MKKLHVHCNQRKNCEEPDCEGTYYHFEGTKLIKRDGCNEYSPFSVDLYYFWKWIDLNILSLLAARLFLSGKV